MLRSLVLCGVLLIPGVSQASVFGFLFGTDHPQVEIVKARMRHDKEMDKRQKSYNLKMAKVSAKHQEEMVKRGVAILLPQQKVYYTQRGSLRFYHVK